MTDYPKRWKQMEPTSRGTAWSWVMITNWTVEPTRCSYRHRGGVQSSFGWNCSAYSQLKYANSTSAPWENVSGGYDSVSYSGYDDEDGITIVDKWDSFSRTDVDRYVWLGNDGGLSLDSGSFHAIASEANLFVPHLPNAPASLTASLVNATTINLTWATPTRGYSSMKLEARANGGSWVSIASVNSPTTSYSWSNAVAGNTYEFRARAYYEQAYSGYTYTQTPISTRPDPPSSISGQALADSNSIKITMENTSQTANSLQWQMSTDNKATWTPSTPNNITNSMGNPVTSFSISTSYEGVIYVRLRNAYTVGGTTQTSDWLESGQIITKCPPEAPQILSPTAQNVQADNVVFRWKHIAPDNASQTGWQISITVDETTQVITNTQETASSSEYTRSFENGKVVKFKIRTKGAATTPDSGWGAWSSELTFKACDLPSVHITSPQDESEVHSMPIQIRASVSDENGTIERITVSLKYDGETIYSNNNPTVVNGVIQDDINIPALIVNEMWYKVYVEVGSSTSLSNSDESDFRVAFTPPQEGAIYVLNDKETGFVDITAFYDNTGAEEPAINISVARVNPDNSVIELISDETSGTRFIDKYAPLNEEYKYAITTRASSDAVNTIYVPNIVRSPRFFFYFGEDMASGMWQQVPRINYERPHQEELYFSGRTYPISVDDVAESDKGSLSFIVASSDEVKALKRLKSHSGSVIYKATYGDVFHVNVSVSLEPVIEATSYKSRVTINYTRVSGVDL